MTKERPRALGDVPLGAHILVQVGSCLCAVRRVART